MDRRSFLASLGAAASLALAGCPASGGSGPGRDDYDVDATPTDSTTTRETSSPPPTETPPPGTPTTTTRVTDDLDATHSPGTVVDLPTGGKVGVKSVSARNAVTYRGAWMTRLAGDSNRQYVVVRAVRRRAVTTTRSGDRSAFSLRVDGREYDPGVGGGPFGSGRFPRRLFSVPADLDPGRASVVWDGTDGVPDQEFALTDPQLRSIRLNPSFSVESFSVSDEASPAGRGASVDVSFSVSNDGQRDGTFVGLVDLPPNEGVADYHPSRTTSTTVPRGGTETWSGTVEWSMPPDDGGKVRLDWSGGGRSEYVSFDDVEDPI